MKNVELLPLYEELVKPFVDGSLKTQIRKSKAENDHDAMTCVPAFVGENYNTHNIRLMIIGRAVNGWEADWKGNEKEIAQQWSCVKI